MDESWQTEADEYMALIDDPAAPWDARVRASEGLRNLLRLVEPLLVVEALREGASWAEIGAALGVSRQAAHQRYGPS